MRSWPLTLPGAIPCLWPAPTALCRPRLHPRCATSCPRRPLSLLVVVGHCPSLVVVVLRCALSSSASVFVFIVFVLIVLVVLIVVVVPVVVLAVWCVVVGTMGLVGDDGGCGTTSVMCQRHTDAHCWPWYMLCHRGGGIAWLGLWPEKP